MKFSPDQLEELRDLLLDRLRKLPQESLLEVERAISQAEEIYSPHQSEQ